MNKINNKTNFIWMEKRKTYNFSKTFDVPLAFVCLILSPSLLKMDFYSHTYSQIRIFVEINVLTEKKYENYVLRREVMYFLWSVWIHEFHKINTQQPRNMRKTYANEGNWRANRQKWNTGIEQRKFEKTNKTLMTPGDVKISTRWR